MLGLEDHLRLLGQTGAEFAVRRIRTKADAEAPVPKAAFGSLDDVARHVLECRKCPLAKTRTRAVPGEGHPAAALLFVGEAPGHDEDVQGRPFVGRAGQLLTKIIAAMSFRREDVYITNVVKCRPPENRTPAREEVEACAPYLAAQIEILRPKAIVSLGKSATDFFLRSGKGMTQLRGEFFDFHGIPVMPTFHPSYVLRQESIRSVKKQVWQDMQKVMKLLGRT
ncbi:MAG: uracil-DNA glycosylase [Candidatus Aminicenantes bacterium]|nr:uracil-DNA glycosylase [Candidatus Aminicenantes bacterium]